MSFIGGVVDKRKLVKEQKKTKRNKFELVDSVRNIQKWNMLQR